MVIFSIFWVMMVPGFNSHLMYMTVAWAEGAEGGGGSCSVWLFLANYSLDLGTEGWAFCADKGRING